MTHFFFEFLRAPRKIALSPDGIAFWPMQPLSTTDFLVSREHSMAEIVRFSEVPLKWNRGQFLQ
ncbi:MAG: hypothetical protein F4X84_01830 [Synechococcus sp. SB0662_bin_45]|uniref:Uncharacterized protein n=1 Tax=Synechococcus sp. SB0676_bin_10 TaxID=2604869 RepID=A0A6B1F215_9SYNE|nr:hypothetical protein [Cyanobacteria bacterium MAG IRC4_bin_6]MXW13110.1 hypothetical protein [Synechococcus sp. SB0668_bin_13]MYE21137.1 hypothetical protein [Synechococcus sp. SB0662_bin_45]MYG37460.1 hypothetical protein [Synechococcus sp. SB0676_bin_10]MYG64192.1 hypothetical protein [Synechococcus sp. SB0675_bin_7]MYK06602.1 hypothetical protein [Synechococcus sp. SB0670_bin_20]